MILSRVIEHVKAQHWTAIFLDFVIVVMGVFIGIQLGNWNAARTDRVRAHDYLERIAADLDADIVAYKDRMQFWSDVSNYGAEGLAYADTGATRGLSPWQFLLAYFQASQVAEFYATDATYQELKSAGELGLIADTRLRDDLAFYYTQTRNPALTERPAYRMHVRGVIPLDVQLYIWDHCYGTTRLAQQQMLDCKSPIDNQRATEIVDAIKNDKALMDELRYWMSTMHVARIIGGGFLELAGSMRASVSGALGEAPTRPAP